MKDKIAVFLKFNGDSAAGIYAKVFTFPMKKNKPSHLLLLQLLPVMATITGNWQNIKEKEERVFFFFVLEKGRNDHIKGKKSKQIRIYICTYCADL